jgi:hypothetical protein
MYSPQTFGVGAPERIINGQGNIYEPLFRLWLRYQEKAVSLARKEAPAHIIAYYYQAAQRVRSLIPNRYEEAIAD